MKKALEDMQQRLDAFCEEELTEPYGPRTGRTSEGGERKA